MASARDTSADHCTETIYTYIRIRTHVYVYSHALNCTFFLPRESRAASVLVLVQRCLTVSMPLKGKLTAAQECQCLSSPRLSANSRASYFGHCEHVVLRMRI